MTSPHADDFSAIDVDRILGIQHEMTADAGAYVVIIAGALDAGQVRPLVSQYLASLPGTTAEAYGQRVGQLPAGFGLNPAPRQIEYTVSQEIPQAMLSLTWATDQMGYSVAAQAQNNLLAMVLSQMLQQRIREEMGASYSPSANPLFMMVEGQGCIYGIQMQWPVRPEMVDAVADEVKRMMQQMAEGCDAALLQNAQAMLRSGFEQSLQQDNASWTSFARIYMIYGIDYAAEYYEALARTTVQDLASHASHLLSQGHCYHTVARPGK